MPTVRISNTFVKVFPYVVQVPGILIGSNEPFEIDATEMTRRQPTPASASITGGPESTSRPSLRRYMNPAPVRIGPEFDRTTLIDVNTDLFPKDEYDLTRP